MEHNIKNLELQQMRKEKLLQRLASLSPQSRMAILGAAMELKQLRKVKLDSK